MRQSIDPTSSLIVLVWNQDKGEFIEAESIEPSTFANQTSIKRWVSSTRHDKRLGKLLSKSISTGYLSILQVAPRDPQQVCTQLLI
jgi:hypothetical protein